VGFTRRDEEANILSGIIAKLGLICILTFGEFPKQGSFLSLVLIPRTFGTIGTLEHLEPALVFNELNGLNDLNGLQY